MNDTIYRQAAIDACLRVRELRAYDEIEEIKALPPAQQQYEPVTVEDFAKTMSENTPYSFMAWYGTALELMKEQGFVICKKTM